MLELIFYMSVIYNVIFSSFVDQNMTDPYDITIILGLLVLINKKNK